MSSSETKDIIINIVIIIILVYVQINYRSDKVGELPPAHSLNNMSSFYNFMHKLVMSHFVSMEGFWF